MDEKLLLQEALAIRSELVPEDFESQPELATIPMLRLVQANSQNAPKGATPGEFYSVNAAYIRPTTNINITVGKVDEGRALWPAWSGKSEKHLVCQCLDNVLGIGIPYVFDEERQRWVPGEIERMCAACPHNQFRQRTLPTLSRLDGVGEQDWCKTYRVYRGLMLPEKESFTVDEVIPFKFQIGSHIKTKAYQNLFVEVGDSSYGPWDYVVFKAKQLGVPIQFLQLRMVAEELTTDSGKSYVPLFEIIGTNKPIMTGIRAIIAKQNQLALNAADIQDEPELDEHTATGGNGSSKKIMLKDPNTGMYVTPAGDDEAPF